MVPRSPPSTLVKLAQEIEESRVDAVVNGMVSPSLSSRPWMPVDGVLQETAGDKESDEVCVNVVGYGMVPRFLLTSALVKLTPTQFVPRSCRGAAHCDAHMRPFIVCI